MITCSTSLRDMHCSSPVQACFVNPQGGNSARPYNKQLADTLRLLNQQIQRYNDNLLRLQRYLEREKALCDLLVHQEMFTVLLSHRRRCQTPSRAGAASIPPAQQLHPCISASLHQWNHQCGLCSTLSVPQQPADTQAWPPPSASLAEGSISAYLLRQLGQSQPPNSYTSNLLLSSTVQQWQRVINMTADDWHVTLESLMSQMQLLQELVSRHKSHQQVTKAAPISPFSRFVMPAFGQDGATRSTHDDNAYGNPHSTTSTAGAAGVAHLGSQQTPSNRSEPAQASAGQPPLGLCPVWDLQTLLHMVDDAMTIVVLALIYNHIPLLTASTWSYSFPFSPQITQQQQQAVEPSVQHWQLVAEQLQLLDAQKGQLRACVDEYNRLNKFSRQLGVALEADLGSPHLALAVEEVLQHRSRPAAEQQVSTVTAELLLLRHQSEHGTRLPSSGVNNPFVTGSRLHGVSAGFHRGLQGAPVLGGHGGPSLSSDTKPQPRQESSDSRYRQQQQQQQRQQRQVDASNAGAASCSTLHSKLQNYIDYQHLHLLMATTLVINTLSRAQLAAAFVASYPFPPDFLAIAAGASKNLQQQQRRSMLRNLDADGMTRPLVSDHTGTTTRRSAAGDQVPCVSAVPNQPDTGLAGTGSQALLAGVPAASNSLLHVLNLQHTEQREKTLQMQMAQCWGELGQGERQEMAFKNMQHQQRHQQQEQQQQR